METTQEPTLIDKLCDEQSPQYSKDVSWWVNYLRDTKQKAAAESDLGTKFDYAMYHGCRGVFESTARLLAGKDAAHMTTLGEAVITELTAAAPLATEGSSARKSIEDLISNIRKNIGKAETAAV